MEKRMSAWEARRQFGQVLKDVTRNRTTVIVESHGEPVAAVVPIGQYEAGCKRRRSFLEQLREISARTDLTDEEAETMVATVMRETGRDYVP